MPTCSIKRSCDRGSFDRPESSSSVPIERGRAATFLKVHTKKRAAVGRASRSRSDRRRDSGPGRALSYATWSTKRRSSRLARTPTRWAPNFSEALQKITLRSCSPPPAQPGRSRAPAYPRVWSRVARAAPATWRSGASRIDRAARDGARSDAYQLPVDDRTSYAEDYLRARITGALGGRAAGEAGLRGGDDRQGHSAGHGNRPPDGLAMGDEQLGPISFVAAQDAGLPPAFQHQPYSEATPEADQRRSSPDRWASSPRTSDAPARTRSRTRQSRAASGN